MKTALTVLFLVAMAVSAWGQMADEAQVEQVNRSAILGVEPAVSPFSLIDLSRVRWSHSYSVGFFSGGNYSGSLGMYNTSMFYEFSSKLSLRLDIGIAHNTGAIWGDGNSDARFLPGFQLDYRPSDNFRMSIGLQHYNGYVSPYYYYPSYLDYSLGR